MHFLSSLSAGDWVKIVLVILGALLLIKGIFTPSRNNGQAMGPQGGPGMGGGLFNRGNNNMGGPGMNNMQQPGMMNRQQGMMGNQYGQQQPGMNNQYSQQSQYGQQPGMGNQYGQQQQMGQQYGQNGQNGMYR